MNTAFVILTILIFSLLLNIHYIIKSGVRIEISEREMYSIAIDVFNSWKNEIGGVSLKGVGQHYEKWIWKKLNESEKR